MSFFWPDLVVISVENTWQRMALLSSLIFQTLINNSFGCSSDNASHLFVKKLLFCLKTIIAQIFHQGYLHLKWKWSWVHWRSALIYLWVQQCAFRGPHWALIRHVGVSMMIYSYEWRKHTSQFSSHLESPRLIRSALRWRGMDIWIVPPSRSINVIVSHFGITIISANLFIV